MSFAGLLADGPVIDAMRDAADIRVPIGPRPVLCYCDRAAANQNPAQSVSEPTKIAASSAP